MIKLFGLVFGPHFISKRFITILILQIVLLSDSCSLLYSTFAEMSSGNFVIKIHLHGEDVKAQYSGNSVGISPIRL